MDACTLIGFGIIEHAEVTIMFSSIFGGETSTETPTCASAAKIPQESLRMASVEDTASAGSGDDYGPSGVDTKRRKVHETKRSDAGSRNGADAGETEVSDAESRDRLDAGKSAGEAAGKAAGQIASMSASVASGDGATIFSPYTQETRFHTSSARVLRLHDAAACP